MTTAQSATEKVHVEGGVHHELTPKETRLVIAASSLGTVFEWYDFFIYGTLAAIIGRTFFPSGDPTMELLLSLLGFAVGFGFRPLGAILFGYFGDKLGRKYTFLMTITLMGLATAAIAFVPAQAQIGMAAPVIILILRILQGLALGGEYGGAAIYVAEHAPPEKRGFYTSFIQASVIGGFILSLAVVLGTKLVFGGDAFDSWAWRLPFGFSLVLLAVSLWMRLKLNESPVFKAMKEQGQVARNPLKESFTYPGNIKRIMVALFGIAAGLTVISYTAMFSLLFLLTGPLRVDTTQAEMIVGAGSLIGTIAFIFAGWWSDRIGRKTPIILGYILTLALLFPAFHLVGRVANPEISRLAETHPVLVTGSDCAFNPLAKEQATECGKLLAGLTKAGIPYDTQVGPALSVSVGGERLGNASAKAVEDHIRASGISLEKVKLGAGQIAVVLAVIIFVFSWSGLTYGPVAALLSEMFPPAIRYSSLSIPYHIGTGYFGGFLPLVSQYINAKTGDPYNGLWYTFAVVLMALLVTWFGLKETHKAAASDGPLDDAPLDDVPAGG